MTEPLTKDQYDQLHPMERLKRYIGFTDDDTEHLRSLLPVVEPIAPAAANRFYDAILADPRAIEVLESPAQVERLKLSLTHWIVQLLEGPHDVSYYERRLVIGRVHVKVKLPQQYMFTAMNLLRADLTTHAWRGLPPGRAEPVVLALNKIMDLELAIMLGTYMEERERRELEGLRELIISHLPVTALFLDKDRRILVETHATPRIFRTASIVGRRYDEVLLEKLVEAAALDECLDEAARTRSEIVLPRVDVVSDDEPRAFRITVINLDHPQAESLVHIEDLTDILSMEARQRQAEHLAQLGTMAATVAHEIRNPLAGMASTIQVIMGSIPTGDPRHGVLEKVRAQTMRLGDLVGDLLAFARPVRAQLAVVDLGHVARHATADAAAAGHGQTEVIGSGRAIGDGALLAQVFLNLVQNAWQAGAKRVVVELGPGAARVYDDGPGIPAADKERIFQAFVTTKTRGTGLGLPVSVRAMEAMGGDLRLGHSPLGGAAFELTLPAEQ